MHFIYIVFHGVCNSAKVALQILVFVESRLICRFPKKQWVYHILLRFLDKLKVLKVEKET